LPNQEEENVGNSTAFDIEDGLESNEEMSDDLSRVPANIERDFNLEKAV